MLNLFDLGIIGLVLILVAWLPDTIKSIRKSKVSTRIEFLILYAMGSFFLTLHAYNIKDIVFITLNALATTMALINLFAKIQYNSQRTNKKS